MHVLPLTIYYEDTDAQGVVYYANYLKFFERARTELLRGIGYNQKDLMDEGSIFVVREVEIKFKKPAYLDQKIEIHSQIRKVGKVTFDFSQKVLDDSDILLCNGFIKCGCISMSDFKPKALPTELFNGMKSLLK
tara:strand:+ start:541 stop:942 length:402 start_codon:yes stop_codon:yes gene_type:complete